MNDYVVKDSGQRQAFPTGAVRDAQVGKGRYDLLPFRALDRLAKHFEKGAIKYGDNNWQKGMPVSRFLDSAMRHLSGYMEGKNDEDHLIAAAWNIMAAVEIETRLRSEPGPSNPKLPREFLDIGPYRCPVTVETQMTAGDVRAAAEIAAQKKWADRLD